MRDHSHALPPPRGGAGSSGGWASGRPGTDSVPSVHHEQEGSGVADARGGAARLLAATGRGDVDSFATLHDLFAPQVFGLALRVLGDHEHAQECTQEVFSEVWQEAGRFDASRGSAATFVLVIAHRCAVERVRKEQPVLERSARHEQRMEAPDRHAVDVDPGHPLELEVGQARLVSALPLLSEVQREAIGLAYFAAMTPREIAAHLGVPRGTIESRIRDGLIRLERSLHERTIAEENVRGTDAPALVAELARAQRAVVAHEQAKGRLAEERGTSIEAASAHLDAGGPWNDERSGLSMPTRVDDG
jgi:RNA polymerase sigma-70 factor (ECF subfamily)